LNLTQGAFLGGVLWRSLNLRDGKSGAVYKDLRKCQRSLMCPKKQVGLGAKM